MLKPKLSIVSPEYVRRTAPAGLIGLVCGSLLSACSGLSTGYQKGPYIAGGAGVSQLSPITTNTQYSLEDDADTALWASLGFDLTRRLSAELHYAELGDAVLGSTDQTVQSPVPINYAVFGLSALYYALGNGATLDGRRGGLGAYLRLGVTDMTHDADIRLDIDDSPQLWAGLGAEYMFSNGLAARLEYSSYDGDAQALNVGAVYRFGARGPQLPDSAVSGEFPGNDREVVPERPAEPIERPADTPSTDNRTEPVTPDVEAPSITPPVTPPSDPVVAPEPAINPEPVVASRPVAGIQQGIQFGDGTAVLTSVGQRTVRALGEQLNANPGLRIELQTYTDNRNGEAAAMQLTRQRVVAVARDLIAMGVSKSQLSARAFGSLEMLSGADSRTGRILDNRVELVILAQ